MAERNVQLVPLREGGVYLVTTTDRYSLVAEYAGRDGRTLVFVARMTPVRIPERRVSEVVRLG